MPFGSNVRTIRLEKGLSLKDLAKLSQVSFSMLSKVERGQKTPTIRVAIQIANALEISLTSLVEEQEGISASIVRKEQRTTVTDPGSGVEKQFLCPELQKSGIEYLWLHIPKGASTGRIPVQPPGIKGTVLVCHGCLTLVVGPAQYFLEQGDTIYYQTDGDYELINASGQDAACYTITDLGRKT
jgi:transcriptional regulator with XRE-family HTH domain